MKSATSTVFAKLRAYGIHIASIGAGLLLGPSLGPELQNVARRHQADSAASLTPEETALVKSIFGQEFETGNIRKYFHHKAPWPERKTDTRHSAAYVTNTAPNEIHFIKTKAHANDYAKDRSLRAVFIHEVTHIWQNRQNGRTQHCNDYEYKLTPQSRLADFCGEQQAEIVADYMSILVMQPKQYGDAVSRGRSYRKPMYEGHANLARVVEDVFPAARATRETEMARLRDFAGCADKARTKKARATCQKKLDSPFS